MHPAEPLRPTWPSYLQWLPCSKWTWHTWCGLSTIFCGGCVQGAVGIINIWGAVVVYFTSRFRGENPHLLVETTLYAFPLTYVCTSISMQLGAYLFHKISIKLQLLIGCVMFSGSVYLSQFAESFEMFILFYCVLAGFGIGIVYFLPVLCGWSYFPTIRPIVAGSILSWFTWVSMGYALYATKLLNPDNAKPTIIVQSGMSVQKFYDPNSPQVEKIPELLTTLAILSLVLALIGIPFIRFNYKEAEKKKNPVLTELDDHLPCLILAESN